MGERGNKVNALNAAGGKVTMSSKWINKNFTISGPTYTLPTPKPTNPIFEDKDIVVINNDETELLRIEHKSIQECMDALNLLLECIMNKTEKDAEKISEAYSKIMKSLLELNIKRELVDGIIYEHIDTLSLDELKKFVGGNKELQEFVKGCIERKVVHDKKVATKNESEIDWSKLIEKNKPNHWIDPNKVYTDNKTGKYANNKYWTSTGTSTEDIL